MPDIDTRLYTVEQDIKQIFGRLSKVEDKTSGAWKTIGEQREDILSLKDSIGKLEKRMDNLEVDMKEQKVAMNDVKRMLKVILIVLCVLGFISLGFFVYIWRHDADLAKSLLTFGVTVGGAIA